MSEMTMSEMAGMRPFTGYRSLLGPEQLLLNPGRRVSTAAEYLAWQKFHVTLRGGAPWDSPERAMARVNHGRWIADCLWCRSGMLTRPEMGVAYCAECGALYHKTQVEYPRESDAIERILLRRVRREQQNWDWRQTVEALEQENQSPEVLTP
ncbi:MAG: hypothetical protein GY783_02505 [Gammaproteobacteria bacterium]|nr:hypothetical protein [Gammaproteobacteria bacterium]